MDCGSSFCFLCRVLLWYTSPYHSNNYHSTYCEKTKRYTYQTLNLIPHPVWIFADPYDTFDEKEFHNSILNPDSNIQNYGLHGDQSNRLRALSITMAIMQRPRRVSMATSKPIAKCVVIEDYVSNESGELSLKTGEKITIYEDYHEGWYWGVKDNGDMGLFPSRNVSLMI